MTNTLEGRELAVACARAMGAEVSDDAGAFRFGGVGWRGVASDPLTVDEMLAWLTKVRRGFVQTTHEQDWCYSMFFPIRGLAQGQDRPSSEGATLHEALQRLVVAVAEGKR